MDCAVWCCVVRGLAGLAVGPLRRDETDSKLGERSALGSNNSRRRLIISACCGCIPCWGRSKVARSILSYGQLFLKPLCNLDSISLSLKQRQGLSSIIHDCNNDHHCLLILERDTTTFTRTFQTLLDNPLG